MKQEMHRQGDVLFTKIEELPEGLKARKSRVIVEGEATGHHHSLVDGRVLEDAQGYLFLAVLKATQVVHQEHHAITLEPGFYRVTRQREYSPEAIRTVID
jgi:hypothetical protein